MSTFAETRTRGTALPATTGDVRLTADRDTVDAGDVIEVTVDLGGAAAVELRVVPENTFDLDLRSMTRGGVVRLKGRRDGKATLIATADGTEHMLHVDCIGPILRITGFGYIPG